MSSSKVCQYLEVGCKFKVRPFFILNATAFNKKQNLISMMKLLHPKDFLKLNTISFCIRILIFLCSILLILLAILAPVQQHFEGYPNGEKIYFSLSKICHQYPTRSFWVFGLPMGLCARCVSGYLGLGLSALFYENKLTYFRRLVLGIILLLLVSIDPIFQLNTNYESTNTIRFFTGILGGFAVFNIINFFPLKFKE